MNCWSWSLNSIMIASFALSLLGYLGSCFRQDFHVTYRLKKNFTVSPFSISFFFWSSEFAREVSKSQFQILHWTLNIFGWNSLKLRRQKFALCNVRIIIWFFTLLWHDISPFDVVCCRHVWFFDFFHNATYITISCHGALGYFMKIGFFLCRRWRIRV